MHLVPELPFPGRKGNLNDLLEAARELVSWKDTAVVVVVVHRQWTLLPLDPTLFLLVVVQPVLGGRWETVPRPVLPS
ncbi:hypothetical protein L1887_17098 [Cichorium endivia]|nr:hypothetical protein L1887_17098 [Cichorium endivia]